jgi:hypothetical protein
MNGMEWRQVPVGLGAERWVTRAGCKAVLVVVHTVTTGQRLAGVLRLIETDLRIQVVFTAAPDVFSNGVAEFLRKLGGIIIPWAQAIGMTFDLALAAAYGELDKLHAPVIVMPHGAGYNKLAVRRESGGAVAARGAYGLDQQSLIAGGRVVPEVIVLSHNGDLELLGRYCPEALPAAEVAGDPCYDQLVVSRPLREAYRRKLGASRGTALVVTTSTWGTGSLFGQAAELHDALLAELPPQRYKVVALMHPNVWYGHGTRQVRAWLGGAMKRGLGLVPPASEWLGALVAADVAISDHGSSGVYASAAGAPVLRGGDGEDDLAPGSAAALLGGLAPRLYLSRPVESQLIHAMAEHQASVSETVAARVTSEPGRFSRNLRRLIYRWLGLTQPSSIPVTPAAGMPTLIRREGRDA